MWLTVAYVFVDFSVGMFWVCLLLQSKMKRCSVSDYDVSNNERQAGRGRETGRQTEAHTERQTDRRRQTTERQRQKNRERSTHTKKEILSLSLSLSLWVWMCGERESVCEREIERERDKERERERDNREQRQIERPDREYDYMFGRNKYPSIRRRYTHCFRKTSFSASPRQLRSNAKAFDHDLH